MKRIAIAGGEGNWQSVKAPQELYDRLGHSLPTVAQLVAEAEKVIAIIDAGGSGYNESPEGAELRAECERFIQTYGTATTVEPNSAGAIIEHELKPLSWNFADGHFPLCMSILRGKKCDCGYEANSPAGPDTEPMSAGRMMSIEDGRLRISEYDDPADIGAEAEPRMSVWFSAQEFDELVKFGLRARAAGQL